MQCDPGRILRSKTALSITNRNEILCFCWRGPPKSMKTGFRLHKIFLNQNKIVRTIQFSVVSAGNNLCVNQPRSRCAIDLIWTRYIDTRFCAEKRHRFCLQMQLDAQPLEPKRIRHRCSTLSLVAGGTAARPSPLRRSDDSNAFATAIGGVGLLAVYRKLVFDSASQHHHTATAGTVACLYRSMPYSQCRIPNAVFSMR